MEYECEDNLHGDDRTTQSYPRELNWPACLPSLASSAFFTPAYDLFSLRYSAFHNNKECHSYTVSPTLTATPVSLLSQLHQFPYSHCYTSFPYSHSYTSFPYSHSYTSFPYSHSYTSFPYSHSYHQFPPTLTATPVSPTLTATPVSPTLTATPVSPTLTATPVSPTLTATPVSPTLTATPVSLTHINLCRW
ncbi:hypothetical protein Pmani_021759 [Petrolisthes manimaculis]|uniref:Uncharacterized protein n=1 Tax=Petrolisthes manimaculis TaxID=1843537 RepID=A0AAE1PFE3_9EUCA|nr:hypothetical protein Pmani_021759 [Petrolisthes manimaculis]